MELPRVERDKEKELIARAQAGDRAAFGALVREHGDEVYTLARRRWRPASRGRYRSGGVDPGLESVASFQGDAALSTWLHRITVNTAWTQRRRARRHSGLPLDDFVEVAAPQGADHPEEAGEVLELRGRLRRALDSLPEPQRQVVVLKDVYDWSHAEIAEAMGISVSAAKVRLHRARARLAVS